MVFDNNYFVKPAICYVGPTNIASNIRGGLYVFLPVKYPTALFASINKPCQPCVADYGHHSSAPIVIACLTAGEPEKTLSKRRKDMCTVCPDAVVCLSTR